MTHPDHARSVLTDLADETITKLEAENHALRNELAVAKAKLEEALERLRRMSEVKT